MSLNQTASDPRTLNKFAKLETKARSVIAESEQSILLLGRNSYLRTITGVTSKLP